MRCITQQPWHRSRCITTRYYFWNELTGDVQWEDPGGAVWRQHSGCAPRSVLADVAYWQGDTKVWYNDDGEQVTDDPKVRSSNAWMHCIHTAQQAMEYLWVESYSEDHGRHFYFNQETQSSTWERPADLAWRRVRVDEVSNEL